MSVPKSLTEGANREAFVPNFAALDKAKRAKLVSKLAPLWVRDSKAHQALHQKKALEVLQDLHNAINHSWEEGREKYMSRCSALVFRETTDVLGPHETGVPKLNEVVLTMAAHVFSLVRPLLSKHGFSDGVKGVVEMHEMIYDRSYDPAVQDSLAWYAHELCMGRPTDLENYSAGVQQAMRWTGHLFWMGILGSTVPPLLTCLSYLQHLSLPPLQRRLRSYSRTVALLDTVLTGKLQELRQERADPALDKKGRVIFIWCFEDDHLDKLAQQGYFEECGACRPVHETTTVYLLAREMNKQEVEGSWPCGRAVKVHIVTDFDALRSLPHPEICVLFHFNPDNWADWLMALFMSSGYLGGMHPPLVVLTIRCAEEAKAARDCFEHFKLECGIPTSMPRTVRVPPTFSRNLYSGMAGNPDIEYDDNGAFAIISRTLLKPERLGALFADSSYQLIQQEVEKVRELRTARLNWTSYLIEALQQRPEVAVALGNPNAGDELSAESLLVVKLALFPESLFSTADLVENGYVELRREEDPADAAAGTDNAVGTAPVRDTTAAVDPPTADTSQKALEIAVKREPPIEEEYRVVYTRVMVRSEPSTKATAVGVFQKGAEVKGKLVEVDGVKWLRVKHPMKGTITKGSQGSRPEDAYMLVDGQSVGLGKLLERVIPPEEAESAEAKAEQVAKSQKSSRSPAVFWGILDLKFDCMKPIEDRVKVLETGDGRLSRFSGCGASIKESFQHDHKLEETIRRAVLTENKKMTHDVIVSHGYGHLRPRQEEFRMQYEPDLADRICHAFGFHEDDFCVLKLCNRQRGAGVIPVAVANLDEVLQELLQPPADIEAWLGNQPKDWAITVVWGCFEEQVRHWWSNECPCFLVEELCLSMFTEKAGAQYDGTMRVGFSLHREHRNKLPPGWVNSPDGPIRVRPAEGDQDTQDDDKVPQPWNDDRPYLDLFRLESSVLRVQWLGGYWKLPIEDVSSQDLRGRIVSVAKQGTAPVPDRLLYLVYAAMGDMVSQLFGPNDMSQGAIKARYKSFPELGSFIIARLACSMRGDRQKSAHLMELAQMYLDKESGPCKNLVSSYIHRNLGVAHAAYSAQWTSAGEQFRKSIEKMPANASSRHLLGVHYMEIGDNVNAAACLENALLLDPDFKAPYACLGVVRLRQGQYEQAAAVSQAGLARHPHTPACQYNLGLACFAQAYLEEQRECRGFVFVAQELRERALQALETARDQRFRDQFWEPKDDAMVAKLREKDKPLVWSEKRLPQDGWRIMGWRP